MDPFRGLGMPRIPGLTELLSILQTQTEALSQLPRTLSDLTGTVRELTQATSRAREPLGDPLRRINDDLMPLIHGLRQAQARVGSVTGILRRRPREDDADAADGY